MFLKCSQRRLFQEQRAFDPPAARAGFSAGDGRGEQCGPGLIGETAKPLDVSAIPLAEIGADCRLTVSSYV